MTVLTQPPTMGDVLKYEVNPNYTRETVTLLMGLPYPVGAVLGRITASGKYTLSPDHRHRQIGGPDRQRRVCFTASMPRLADAVGIVRGARPRHRVPRGPCL